MTEKLLKELVTQLEQEAEHQYDLNIPTNLINVIEDELDKLGIRYEVGKQLRGKNHSLRIYDDREELMHHFVKGFYPNNSKVGAMICNNKYLTEKFLNIAGVKTPVSQLFRENDFNKAKSFVDTISGSLVIKPTSMMMSIGAFLNVTKDNFAESWKKSFEIQKKYKVKVPEVLIQQQINGLELRVTVLEGKVGNVVCRAPGFVVGDGKSTIKELVEEKNEKRKKHAYLKRNLFKIDESLEDNLAFKNKNLNSVLPLDDFLILYTQSNIATGREVFEVTEIIHPNILQQALDATLAIPGIHTSGVDILIEDLKAEEGMVIEVNKSPAFQLSYYPQYGEKSAPLNYIFKSLNLENKVLNNNLKQEDLSNEEFDILLTRYKYMYSKLKEHDKAFKDLLS